jgi:hypothetical protein
VHRRATDRQIASQSCLAEGVIRVAASGTIYRLFFGPPFQTRAAASQNRALVLARNYAGRRTPTIARPVSEYVGRTSRWRSEESAKDKVTPILRSCQNGDLKIDGNAGLPNQTADVGQLLLPNANQRSRAFHRRRLSHPQSSRPRRSQVRPKAPWCVHETLRPQTQGRSWQIEPGRRRCVSRSSV